MIYIILYNLGVFMAIPLFYGFSGSSRMFPWQTEVSVVLEGFETNIEEHVFAILVGPVTTLPTCTSPHSLFQ